MSAHLLDTCVIIDYLRARSVAVAFLEQMEGRPSVSVVTVAELYAGIGPAREEVDLRGVLEHVRILDVEPSIAMMAGRWCRRFGPSHGVEIPDALIAATAEMHGLRLVTRNIRHFPMLDDVLVPYQ